MNNVLKLSIAQLNAFSNLIPMLRLVLWLMCVALAVWVFIQLQAPAAQVAPAMPAVVSNQYQIDQSPEARLMGVETKGGLTPPAVNLLGVFANQAGAGAAVMAVDGQAAQSRRVGEEVSNGWILDEVGLDFAVIRRSGQRHQINLPVLEVDPNLLRKVPVQG